MGRLVMGTAGHIDHGKTSLIRLLTGYDCDRLPEEKQRGITIELGFTHLDLPSGMTLGVVDVPGHERFVRTMVAGAGGIDFVLLVIAADEAVMPQTREHLAICRLLGIRSGLVALTKIDMVDEEIRALAVEDVRSLIADTFLAEAPIVPVSSLTGEGRDELLAALDAMAASVVPRSDSGIFRLPIDRVFTMRGFGTVVTGTTIAGKINVGDMVEILPSGRTCKVRGLQVHGKAADTAFAGQRTAINLQGVAIDEVQRGEMLATPGMLLPTQMLDVELHVERDAPRPVKRRSRVRLHSFTREVMAFAAPLSAEQIEPGKHGMVQLRLVEPVIALPGDHFVLRSYSPVTTVGGGTVLNSHPRKHRAPFKRALEDLEILFAGDLVERMAVQVRGTGRRGITPDHLAPLLGVAGKPLREAYQQLLSHRRIIRVDKDTDRAVDAETLREIMNDIVALLEADHRAHPSAPGLSRAELTAQALKGGEAKVLQRALGELTAEGRVVLEGGTARLASHSVTADEDLQTIRDAISASVRAAGMSAPTLKELQDVQGAGKLFDEALAMLLRAEEVVRIGGVLFFDAATLRRAQDELIAYLQEHGEIDAQGFKALFGLSRKWSIPLAEYFDGIKLTLRVGDKRVLRRKV
ncbi:MAG TPA: selenocysteine-specific translation elongation factor [bacterium]|nr:selenocysteine-specific translation elongation factor [bacterium]